MLLGNLSDRLLPIYQKHCRRHREFYCCLCRWRFRRYTLRISANICVGHVRYCYLFNVVYFLICTLKDCNNKWIFVSNKNVLPGAEATGPVDRHHGHGTKYGTGTRLAL